MSRPEQPSRSRTSWNDCFSQRAVTVSPSVMPTIMQSKMAPVDIL